ncbi:PhzF family phenazine biosynthesis isomerase [Rothia dentocariosa]|uniref:PhzF family phenazine biosynthesis isomerase n=1 Tax=Rothia dentocariosa TaxID=2047 RepID=UPI002880665F|nr:PhzF family phenazine biosynthesis isomerase [Rothia dentocariosa]
MFSRVNIHMIGAFSSAAGLGNPVYVVYDYGKWSFEKRQAFASFVNVSECVFIDNVEYYGNSKAVVNLQIFNPNNVMKFAGHPLIGAVRSFWEYLKIDEGIIHTGPWRVPFVSEHEQESVLSKIMIPDPSVKKYDRSADLCALFEVPVRALPIYDCGPRHVLLRVPKISDLRNFDPQWESLKKFEDIALNVYFAEGGYIENRMFSPSYGVYEDRATGSAVIPLLKELRRENPSRTSINVSQGILRKSGVSMIGQYDPKSGSYTLSGMTTFILEGISF